jgi:hypothetical protein
MPQMPKILGIIFVFLVVAQTALFLSVNFSLQKAAAVTNGADWTMPDPEIKLFEDFKFTKPICVTDQEGKETCSVPWIGEYIVGIYKYAIGIVGILAAVVMMFGGVRWIMAGGNASAISEAKAWIAAALTGLVLVLSSYTILHYINPSLTQPIPIKVHTVLNNNSTNNNSTKCLGKFIEKNNKTEAWYLCNTLCSPNTASEKDFFYEETLKKYCCVCSQPCKNKKEGDLCFLGVGKNQVSGFCYNNNCLTKRGKENEPCGDDGGSICKKGTLKNHCPLGYSWDAQGGRNCEDGLYCCHP